MPLSPWPCFEQDEIDAVAAVLASGRVNYWTGEQGRLFEQEFADYTGTRHAIAVANGTLALELALRALGIGAGDEVIVPPRTFMATASAVVQVGATPVFADVDPDSQTLSAQTVAPVITEKTRAIICVHLAGWPCDMDGIRSLVAGRAVKLIEDCAQAHGARYKGRLVGSLGDIGAFSFCQDKIMTTGGEGGMLTLNDEKVWKLAWSLKDHGKDWDEVHRDDHPPGFRWLHKRFGSNYRMTEMQAAIGRCQLQKLDHWKKLRQRNVAVLNRVLSQYDSVRIPQPPVYIDHAAYKHYAFVRPERLKDGWGRNRIMQEICAQGVPCFSGSCSEIYLEQAFTDTRLAPEQALPVAQQLGRSSLMFLVHPSLAESEMIDYAAIIDRVLTAASH